MGAAEIPSDLSSAPAAKPRAFRRVRSKARFGGSLGSRSKQLTPREMFAAETRRRRLHSEEAQMDIDHHLNDGTLGLRTLRVVLKKWGGADYRGMDINFRGPEVSVDVVTNSTSGCRCCMSTQFS